MVRGFKSGRLTAEDGFTNCALFFILDILKDKYSSSSLLLYSKLAIEMQGSEPCRLDVDGIIILALHSGRL